MLKLFARATVLATAALLALTGSASAASYIVTLNAGIDAGSFTRSFGVKPTQTYKRAVNGFAASLTSSQVSALASNTKVQSVSADGPFFLADTQLPQIVDDGLRRARGLESPTAMIDGEDQRVDADVAIIDSGVDPTHPDLNVVGGVDCGDAGSWGPWDAHGTHVAGIAAALDNKIGVVGAAPGARIWSIRVADRRGAIKKSAMVCATEWLIANASVIEIANMSVIGNGKDDGSCGANSAGRVFDPFHQAVCRAVAAGVTVVAAAGNDARDAANYVPASFDEVITVSAFADLDGRPGGLAPSSCVGFAVPWIDDTLAPFSNYGPDVDIAAPGTCIESTVPGGYLILDGTSMAAPFVAGAGALIRAQQPLASSSAVRDTILANVVERPLPGDPDTHHQEGLLNLAGF